ncbi:HXXEE domain-containing protein [Micropruina sp.]|uniref:HXXEE domain-containing protein n=1 Tax=Micropruina sp. TaxID=2737536 RepID=UPI0039E4A15F
MADRRSRKGPRALFLAWALHDVEEAITFPATCDVLADRSGVAALRISTGQSWAAVGLMGLVIGLAAHRGVRTDGRSRFYRATVAGLHAHVATHLLASVVLRRYTAGVLTAVPVMLPGALVARRELAEAGIPLRPADYALGALLLVPAAFLSHALVRLASGPGTPRTVDGE